jgi:hypothetical protein
VVTLVQQLGHQHGANVTGTAGDEDVLKIHSGR